MPLFRKKEKLIDKEEVHELADEMWQGVDERAGRAPAERPYMLSEDIFLTHEFKSSVKKLNVQTEEEMNVFKEAFRLSLRYNWRTAETYVSLREAKKLYSKDEYEEITKGFIRKAIEDKLSLIDEISLSLCTPEQREICLKDAEKYGIPIRGIVEFNIANSKSITPINERAKDIIFRGAKSRKESPLKVAEGILKELEKKKN